jgi:putative chitinase
MLPNAKPEIVDTFIDPINTTIEKYDISTPLRIAHFIAQIGHESWDLSHTTEIGKDSYFAKYETGTKVGTILGNTQPGDGLKFKGRGLIQLTGRWNYIAAGKSMGVDLATFPELLSQPQCASLSAGWFWTYKKLNKHADADNITTITKLINGGDNGLNDRIFRLKIAKAAIGYK